MTPDQIKQMKADFRESCEHGKAILERHYKNFADKPLAERLEIHANRPARLEQELEADIDRPGEDE